MAKELTAREQERLAGLGGISIPPVARKVPSEEKSTARQGQRLAATYAAQFEGRLKAVAEAGYLAGWNSIGASEQNAVFQRAYEEGRRARLATMGGKTKEPTPGGTGLELIEDHFNVPHSGNDGGPFCEFGQVYYDHTAGSYKLGLQFIGGKRFLYFRESYRTAMDVVQSMQGYASASWATNPRSAHADPRFLKGNYRRV